MEVLNPRSALLSNFEVLSLLRELENDHLARTKTALRIKKEEESSGNLGAIKSSMTAGGQDPTVVEICENLRTVEVEAIQYLSADFQSTSSQSEAGIAKLVRDIDGFELTKAEKLQIVNLAPTEAVELYVIVEELEDRLGDRMNDILEHVKVSLDAPPDASNSRTSRRPNGNVATNGHGQDNDWNTYDEMDEDGAEVMFDDTGEGAGVEGDLDMDDD